MSLIVEFKAQSDRNLELENILQTLTPRFAGEDVQTDTYFVVSHGRLKLREGNIENALIYYNRPDIHGTKQSNVLLYRHSPEKNLKEILERAIGIKVIVIKKRRIFFVDNVKIHFDRVEGLGEFVEVEAIDTDGKMEPQYLQDQCNQFVSLFNIKEKDYEARSYSDLILEQQ
jgi:predicted adenylyl cyclase CyaB